MMMLVLLPSWAAACCLALATIGACVVLSSTIHSAYTHLPHQSENPGSARVTRSASINADTSGVIVNLEMALSGSSSSPVEPIRPLLDLSGSEEGEVQSEDPQPRFDQSAPHNVSGLTGTAAYLHCLVLNLGNRSVSTAYYYVAASTCNKQ
ncbi:uncharacterized protein [Cherax quadricarinatus]